jgi:hypothetical protein
MLWEENNRKKNEENILKLILEKKKKLKKITSSFRIISYFFKSALTLPKWLSTELKKVIFQW